MGWFGHLEIREEFTTMHRQLGEENIDHREDGRINSDFNFEVGTG
jgi:hypothetical protein